MVPTQIDLPHLTGKGDDIGEVPDALERRRPVEAIFDHRECAVPIGFHERASVRQRRGCGSTAGWKLALRKGVERARAELDASA